MNRSPSSKTFLIREDNSMEDRNVESKEREIRSLESRQHGNPHLEVNEKSGLQGVGDNLSIDKLMNESNDERGTSVNGVDKENKLEGKIENVGKGVTSRRFLFSPSITNTINNLNHNTNTNTNVIQHHNPAIPAGLDHIPSSPQRRRPTLNSVFPYSYLGKNPLGNRSRNRKLEGMEYDFRGTGLKKICFLI